MNAKTTPARTTAAASPSQIVVVPRRKMIDLLVSDAVNRSGKGNIIVAEYAKPMIPGKDLKASARAAFPNGINHQSRVTGAVNYNYGKVLERRTDGEETEKGGNWSQALIFKGKITPLSLHKGDCETVAKEGTPGKVWADRAAVMDRWGSVKITADTPRAYLRYEPLTEAQRNAGFGKNDYSRYTDNAGNVIPYADLKPHFYDKPDQAVNHRTLSLGNVTMLKIGGDANIYQPAD